MLEVRIGALRAEAHAAENPRYRSRILLVHGLWGGAWCWRSIGSFLAHRGWEVLAADLRGRSRSREAVVATIRSRDYLADLSELLDSPMIAAAPGEDRQAPIIIGHDLGALLALCLARRERCRAVVALAPPFAEALGPAYRELLARRRGWVRRTILPPRSVPGEGGYDVGRFQEDSARVGGELLRGEIEPKAIEVPALIVAGREDPLVDPERLAQASRDLGCDFVERPAAHWQLEGPGFERHVDGWHRWLVRRLGTDVMRLTGFEDLEEDPSVE